MAAGAVSEDTGTFWQQMWALMIVVIIGAIGGVLNQILMYGAEMKSGTFGPLRFPRLQDKVQIPPLVGMIVFGCLARNFTTSEWMEHYPDTKAGYVRIVCLSFILLRGGLELSFKGKGLTVVLLTLLPQMFEATASAIATHLIFGFPWALSFAQGFTLGAVSPAVLVPSVMILQNKFYGTKKGIPTTMIAASSFDDIIAITLYGVFVTMAMQQAPKPPREDGTTPEPANLGLMVGMNIVQLIVGLVIGIGAGFLCYFIRNAPMWVKFLVCVFMGFAVPIFSEVTSFHESKFVGIIFFGWACYYNWGNNKPDRPLAIIWMFFQPFLFGSVGAAIQFKDIDPSMLGEAIAIILIGVTFRWCGTFLAGMERKYNNKERIFMAFGWIPKATVQAALAGVTLLEVAKHRLEEPYITYSQQMLTTAVFSIIITAPLGAIMINSLGTKLLNYDGPPEDHPAHPDHPDNQNNDSRLDDSERNLARVQPINDDAPADTNKGNNEVELKQDNVGTATQNKKTSHSRSGSEVPVLEDA